MKKVIGLLVLLLACLLVSMPVVAESICLSNDLALEIDLWETKTIVIVQEEVAIQAVTAPDCEMLAVPAAESSIGQIMVELAADGGFEPDSSLYIERQVTNYIRSPTGDGPAA